MKARIKPQDKLSKKTINTVREYTNTVMESQEETYGRRFLKICCVAMAEEFGFGKQRIARFIDKVTEVTDAQYDSDDFWYIVDRFLLKAGIPFDREDYDAIEKECKK